MELTPAPMVGGDLLAALAKPLPVCECDWITVTEIRADGVRRWCTRCKASDHVTAEVVRHAT